MRKLQAFLAFMLMAGVMAIGWLTPAYGGSSSCPSSPSSPCPILLDSPERSPDRQRYNPVTPQQVIQRDKNRVERYKAVPTPGSKGKGAQKPANLPKEGE
jgi:hypothetical protein